jgi:hypothetical protein
MNKLIELSDQYHHGLITYEQYKTGLMAAVSELTEGDCAELAMAIEGWELAKDLN